MHATSILCIQIRCSRLQKLTIASIGMTTVFVSSLTVVVDIHLHMGRLQRIQHNSMFLFMAPLFLHLAKRKESHTATGKRFTVRTMQKQKKRFDRQNLYSSKKCGCVLSVGWLGCTEKPLNSISMFLCLFAMRFRYFSLHFWIRRCVDMEMFSLRN